MNKIVLNDSTFTIPGTWNELTQTQLLSACRVLALPQNAQQQKELLNILLPHHKRQFRLLYKRVSEEDRLHWLQHLTAFFYDPEHTLTKNVLKRFTFKRKRYASPREGLQYSSFGEFVYCEKFVAESLKVRDMRSLTSLTAILYRPRKMQVSRADKDLRTPLYPHRIQEDAIHFKELDFSYKLAAQLFYVGCRQQLARQFEHVFPKEKVKKQKGKNEGWVPIVRALAGDVRHWEKLLALDLYDVLYEFDCKIQEQKKREREARMAKAKANL